MPLTRLVEIKRPDIGAPVLIQGVPGLGLVSRIAVGHLVEELKAEKVAEIYSDWITLPDGSLGVKIEKEDIKVPIYEIYHSKHEDKDFLLVLSDSQPLPTGQYEVANLLLDYAERFDVKLVITLGGYVPESEEVEGVFATSYDERLFEELEPLGVKRLQEGYVTGGAGVLVGLAKVRGIPSVCILATTGGSLPDPDSSIRVLRVLESWLQIKVDYHKLEEIRDAIKRSTIEEEPKSDILEKLQKIREKEERGVPYHL